jgi:hypothetical protein
MYANMGLCLDLHPSMYIEHRAVDVALQEMNYNQ